MNRSTLCSLPGHLEIVALPTRAVHIGRDADGADHYVVPGELVIVVRHNSHGDYLEREESLENRPVSDWVAYVEDRRGWVVCTYDDRPTAEWLLNPRVPQEAGV